MDKIDAKTLHTKLLDLMVEFDDFCKKNNLCYYVIGGTALGMKRHGGFIPWDDDVDIGMPRKDYDELINRMNLLPNHLEIKYYKNTNNYPHHSLKLMDKNTTLIEKNYHNLVGGLYVDIFPLDGVVMNSKRDFHRRKKIYSLRRKIIWHCSTRNEPNILKRMFSFYCKHLNLSKLHSKIEELVRKYAFEDTDYVSNLLGSYGENEIVSKKCLWEPTLYQFETKQFYGPCNLDLFLKSVYGDYMQLPPVEKRFLYHEYYFLDLEKPYSTYISEAQK